MMNSADCLVRYLGPIWHHGFARNGFPASRTRPFIEGWLIKIARVDTFFWWKKRKGAMISSSY